MEKFFWPPLKNLLSTPLKNLSDAHVHGYNQAASMQAYFNQIKYFASILVPAVDFMQIMNLSIKPKVVLNAFAFRSIFLFSAVFT